MQCLVNDEIIKHLLLCSEDLSIMFLPAKHENWKRTNTSDFHHFGAWSPVGAVSTDTSLDVGTSQTLHQEKHAVYQCWETYFNKLYITILSNCSQ